MLLNELISNLWTKDSTIFLFYGQILSYSLLIYQTRLGSHLYRIHVLYPTEIQEQHGVTMAWHFLFNLPLIPLLIRVTIRSNVASFWVVTKHRIVQTLLFWCLQHKFHLIQYPLKHSIDWIGHWWYHFQVWKMIWEAS